jgi:hypothetical protein
MGESESSPMNVLPILIFVSMQVVILKIRGETGQGDLVEGYIISVSGSKDSHQEKAYGYLWLYSFT